MTNFLWSLDADVRQDLQISPNAHLPMEKCVKCGLDITDFDETELAAHSRFHAEMAKEPKSIPSQSHLWSYRDDSKLSSSGWPLYWSGR